MAHWHKGSCACYTMTSPDGLTWTPKEGRPAVIGKADASQSVMWDPKRRRHIAYMRGTRPHERLQPLAGHARAVPGGRRPDAVLLRGDPHTHVPWPSVVVRHVHAGMYGSSSGFHGDIMTGAQSASIRRLLPDRLSRRRAGPSRPCGMFFPDPRGRVGRAAERSFLGLFGDQSRRSRKCI